MFLYAYDGSDSCEDIGTNAIGVPHPFVFLSLLNVRRVQPLGVNTPNPIFHHVLPNPGDDGPIEWIHRMKGDDIPQNAAIDLCPEWLPILSDP